MLITDATLPDGRTRDVRIEGETIAEIGEGLRTTPDERTVDATGK
ncbi:MAG: dihydroorotase, partial [Halapricum sp.]